MPRNFSGIIIAIRKNCSGNLSKGVISHRVMLEESKSHLGEIKGADFYKAASQILIFEALTKFLLIQAIKSLLKEIVYNKICSRILFYCFIMYLFLIFKELKSQSVKIVITCIIRLIC